MQSYLIVNSNCYTVYFRRFSVNTIKIHILTFDTVWKVDLNNHFGFFLKLRIVQYFHGFGLFGLPAFLCLILQNVKRTNVFKNGHIKL